MYTDFFIDVILFRCYNYKKGTVIRFPDTDAAEKSVMEVKEMKNCGTWNGWVAEYERQKHGREKAMEKAGIAGEDKKILTEADEQTGSGKTENRYE